MSSNPWKVTATFKAIASTREEYLQTIGDLKDKAPTEPKENEKKSKLETSHLGLVKNLQTRLETIDAELAVSSRTFLFEILIFINTPIHLLASITDIIIAHVYQIPFIYFLF